MATFQYTRNPIILHTPLLLNISSINRNKNPTKTHLQIVLINVLEYFVFFKKYSTAF